MGSAPGTGGTEQSEASGLAVTAGEVRVTDRTRLRRHAERGRFDRATVHAIVDEAYVAHVGFVVDGAPHVLPMTYGRIGDELYLHGAVGNAMLRSVVDAEVCVTITLLDGLVLARSAFHHSMNHRSVVIFGRGQRVDDPDEKRRAFDAIVDHVLPGRSAVARPTSDAELRTTLVIKVAIDEASAKVRTGGPIDDDADLDLPVWAGVVPIDTVAGAPEQDEAQLADPRLVAHAPLPAPTPTRP
jgi:nitroimidazol reductase NimA-like FMN-containing flavoprotein (pyridoxamine 5'-phosphate oxidase superfamily)